MVEFQKSNSGDESLHSKRGERFVRRPNILWYCTDQQRFDTIGALGNPYVQTPTLDRLVETGTAFTHAFCQSPICTPSRSSFMTGMYPSRVHNCRNGNASFRNHPPLISKLIADRGYDCGMIGKFHLQSSGHRTEPRLDDGYRYWKFSRRASTTMRTGSARRAEILTNCVIALIGCRPNSIKRSGRRTVPLNSSGNHGTSRGS